MQRFNIGNKIHEVNREDVVEYDDVIVSRIIVRSPEITGILSEHE